VNWIQRQIMTRLTYAEALSYTELRPEDVPPFRFESGHSVVK
jgi:hypothetical protein